MNVAGNPIPRTDLIVCPQCDAVYDLVRPVHGERAVCQRCRAVLITPRRQAGMQIIALSVAILVLIIAAAIFPFISISAGGTSNSVSILDAALAFSDGPLVVLAWTTAGLIVVIPFTRVVLSLYVLVPIVRDQPPARHAVQAFKYSEILRPWSMAEIFVIGCAVALVKIRDLADVSLGPAFWMFSVLVVLVVVQESFLCRWSVWNALSKAEQS